MKAVDPGCIPEVIGVLILKTSYFVKNRSRYLSQPIHLGTQPKTTTGTDREQTIYVNLDIF